MYPYFRILTLKKGLGYLLQHTLCDEHPKCFIGAVFFFYRIFECLQGAQWWTTQSHLKIICIAHLRVAGNFCYFLNRITWFAFHDMFLVKLTCHVSLPWCNFVKYVNILSFRVIYSKFASKLFMWWCCLSQVFAVPIGCYLSVS